MFKVGDRVRVVSDSWYHRFQGSIGVVVEIDEDGDNNVKIGNDRVCFCDEELELTREEPKSSNNTLSEYLGLLERHAKETLEFVKRSRDNSYDD